MNSAVEQGLLAFLADQLEATTQTVETGPPALSVLACTIESKLVSLHANVGMDTLPASLARIVVGAEVKHDVGALHMAEVSILVSSPGGVAGATDTTHRAIVAAIKEAFVPENEADLSSAMQTAADCTTARWFVIGWVDTIAEERWQSRMTLRLGLHEV